MKYDAAMDKARNDNVRVARRAWHSRSTPMDKRLWVGFMPGTECDPWVINRATFRLMPAGRPIRCAPYFVQADDSGHWCVGWRPAPSDLRASDWFVFKMPR